MRNVESVAGCTFDALGLLKHVCPFRHVDVVPGCNRRKDEVFVGPVLAAPEVAARARINTVWLAPACLQVPHERHELDRNLAARVAVLDKPNNTKRRSFDQGCGIKDLFCKP